MRKSLIFFAIILVAFAGNLEGQNNLSKSIVFIKCLKMLILMVSFDTLGW